MHAPLFEGLYVPLEVRVLFIHSRKDSLWMSSEIDTKQEVSCKLRELMQRIDRARSIQITAVKDFR